MKQLQKFDLVYLATPYAKYPEGTHEAFACASWISAKLLKSRIKIYSPIAHTHPIAIYGNINPTDNKIWLPFNETMINKSDALVVGMMDTWQDSFGVSHEINRFVELNKPVFYLNIEKFTISKNP